MRQDPEGVTVAEGAILEQSHGSIEIVELCRDVTAFGSGPNEVETASMHGHVRLPILQMRVRTMVQEHRPLQRRVVPDCVRK